MSKVPSLSYKKVIAALERDGEVLLVQLSMVSLANT